MGKPTIVFSQSKFRTLRFTHSGSQDRRRSHETP